MSNLIFETYLQKCQKKNLWTFLEGRGLKGINEGIGMNNTLFTKAGNRRNEAMKRSTLHRFNFLSALNASSLHCLKFLPKLTLYRFIASEFASIALML
jgi:predicted membrane-bound spermidine synthase